MKKVFCVLTFSVVYSLSFGLASLAAAKASGADDPIATIRSRYATINQNIKRYRKVAKELPGYSAEGGTMEAYFDGNSIKKIVARFYGEVGKAEEDYYFWNDQLIFVFRRESTYDRPLSGKVVATKENRFYFDNARMIRWIDENGRQVPSRNSNFPEKQHEYLGNSQQFVSKARS